METIYRTYSTEAEADAAVRRAQEFGWALSFRHMMDERVHVVLSREEDKSKKDGPLQRRPVLAFGIGVLATLCLCLMPVLVFAATPSGKALLAGVPAASPTDVAAQVWTPTPQAEKEDPTETPTPESTVEPVGLAPRTEQPVSGSITVIDGDTVTIGETTYRIIGFDSPERDECGYEIAGESLAYLFSKPSVTVITDDRKDKYGRTLASFAAEGVDMGLTMITAGMAMARYDSRDGYEAHPLEGEYHDAHAYAQANNVGLWGTCGGFDTKSEVSIISTAIAQATSDAARTSTPVGPTSTPRFTATPTPPHGGNCDPSYPTVCIPSPPPDLDCRDISYRRFSVVGSDPHHFDADHDGIGCES